MDLIRKVGPSGNYLEEDHTLEHHRQEFWLPRFFNRNTPDTWIQNGSKTYGEVITQKTIQILKAHKSEPLPEEVSRCIDEIYSQAEKTLSDRQFET